MTTTHPTSGSRPAPSEGRSGLEFEPYFAPVDGHPYDRVAWSRRDAVIQDAAGEMVFEQRGVEFPDTWSQTAVNVVASKYFRGKLGSPERESSLRQLIDRVVGTLSDWGEQDGYFATHEDRLVFERELCHLLLHQYAAFNSPVWFNLGNEAHPQCSACFIISVEDTMDSIMDLAKTEAMLFKHGSGTGTNLSPLRSKRESLSSGGTSSGPVSFMRGYDAFAGVVKSGGKTRRAAKMVILDVDHPDIEEFIHAKESEERKAWALIEEGYDGGFNVEGGAYDAVFFQNANHSVRVTDEFMEAAARDDSWTTHARLDDAPVETLRAGGLLDAIAEATWVCGDPGLQFDTTIQTWHTCPEDGRIVASNPCSEYMFLNDTACNLASLNLLELTTADGELDAEAFTRACEIVITAQEILVDRASYPTPKIEANSHLYRPLGIGFANLGALLMRRGLPYDSGEGRATAAVITALLSGTSYRQSARIAALQGPFAAFERNRAPMAGVMERHRSALVEVDADLQSEVGERVGLDVRRAATVALDAWDEVVRAAETGPGLRNSQISVLAPTGTIGFMMDCDTTGIEPDIGLVKYKRLVGGGMMTIVNQSVAPALERLGYDRHEIDAILDHIESEGTIEGAPGLRDEHLAVFDCAFKPAKGERTIHHSGHLGMMAAVQPFLSGAISKTINMPQHSTVAEIREAYLEAWKLGLKAVAIYRDGCKRSQPLSLDKDEKQAPASHLGSAPTYRRRRLPDERQAITHKFSVGGHEGYITVGLFEDGQPGEIFLVMAKEGSTVSGLSDAFATSISIALQSGVPLATLIRKFSHVRFEPSGFTSHRQIPMASSIIDYIFRWLGSKFLDSAAQEELGIQPPQRVEDDVSDPAPAAKLPRASQAAVAPNDLDAPSCPQCGSIMVRNGSCHSCWNCGATSGCG